MKYEHEMNILMSKHSLTQSFVYDYEVVSKLNNNTSCKEMAKCKKVTVS